MISALIYFQIYQHVKIIGKFNTFSFVYETV